MRWLWAALTGFSLIVPLHAEIGEINIRAVPSEKSGAAASPDASALWLKTGTRMTVVVRDPEGRRTGVDAVSYRTLKEIPGSQCDVDFVANTYTGEEHSEAYERIALTPARKGTYTLLLHGLQTGPYEISAAALSRDGSSEPSKNLEGMISEGEDKRLTLSFDPAPHSTPSFVDAQEGH